jgi:hypothetical protein
LDEIKASDSNSMLSPPNIVDRGKWIIDAKPNVTVTTTKVQLEELKEPKEICCIFDS